MLARWIWTLLGVQTSRVMMRHGCPATCCDTCAAAWCPVLGAAAPYFLPLPALEG